MLGKLLARNPYPKVARAVPQSGQGRTPKWPGPYPKVARAVPQSGQGRNSNCFRPNTNPCGVARCDGNRGIWRSGTTATVGTDREQRASRVGRRPSEAVPGAEAAP